MVLSAVDPLLVRVAAGWLCVSSRFILLVWLKGWSVRSGCCCVLWSQDVFAAAGRDAVCENVCVCELEQKRELRSPVLLADVWRGKWEIPGS